MYLNNVDMIIPYIPRNQIVSAFNTIVSQATVNNFNNIFILFMILNYFLKIYHVSFFYFLFFSFMLRYIIPNIANTIGEKRYTTSNINLFIFYPFSLELS